MQHVLTKVGGGIQIATCHSLIFPLCMLHMYVTVQLLYIHACLYYNEYETLVDSTSSIRMSLHIIIRAADHN